MFSHLLYKNVKFSGKLSNHWAGIKSQL